MVLSANHNRYLFFAKVTGHGRQKLYGEFEINNNNSYYDLSKFSLFHCTYRYGTFITPFHAK